MTEWAARLPSALATVATVLGTFLLGNSLFHRRAGLWAALVLLTSYGVFAHSQMILPDTPMVAFGVLAGYWFWRAVTGPGSRRALIGFDIAGGLMKRVIAMICLPSPAERRVTRPISSTRSWPLTRPTRRHRPRRRAIQYSRGHRD